MLRQNCVSLLESFAQTLGVLSPLGTISVIIPLLIASAGNGTWLLLLIVLCTSFFVMAVVLRFASLHSSAGSLAAFAGLGLGSRVGILCGWIYVLGMLCCVSSASLASAAYLDLLLEPAFGAAHAAGRSELAAVVFIAGAWLAAHRSVTLSTRLMLAIESVALLVIFILLLTSVVNAHAWMDHAQRQLTGVHFSGLQGGLVLAFMLIGGFEGATSLGEESLNPRSIIPRAIIRTMVPLTVLYLFVTYSMVSLQNRGIIPGAVNGLMVPFASLARGIGARWLAPITSLLVAMSFFACTLASLTIGARVLFAMGRDGPWWRSFGKAHPLYGTPHRAIALLALCAMLIALSLAMTRADFSVGFDFVTQLGSLGILAAYLLVAVALPFYLGRRRCLSRKDAVVSGVAAALIGLVLVLSVYPPPAAPISYVPYTFFGSVAVCLSASTFIRSRRSAGRGAPAARRS